jgi:hypothetical protein
MAAPCTTRPSGLAKQGPCKICGVPAVLPNWAAKTATKTKELVIILTPHIIPPEGGKKTGL